MSVKEFIESEIERHEETLRKLNEFNSLIHRKETLIRELKNLNKPSVDNFNYDWGAYFPWFEENFKQFKGIRLERTLSRSPHYHIQSHGTDEEREKLRIKEREILNDGVAPHRLELLGFKAKRDKCIFDLGGYVGDITIDYDEFSSESQIELILDYLRAVSPQVSGLNNVK